MEGHAITFERLEADYGLGPIRAIEVEHVTRRVRLICDEPPQTTSGSKSMAVRQVGYHSVQGSTVQRGGNDF